MSFKVGDLVKLRLMDDGGPWEARYADWRGHVTDIVESDEELVHVTPPIPYHERADDLVLGDVDGIVVAGAEMVPDGGGGWRRRYLRVWSSDEPGIPDDAHRARAQAVRELVARFERGAGGGGEGGAEGGVGGFTRIPVDFLALVVPRRRRPKSATKRGRRPKKGAKSKAKKQETLEAIELQKDDDDGALFLDARAGELGDVDADFHDVAEHTREKTLSAAVQSDLAQARTKKKGGRGRRRRRKRTRRTRRRKKRRTRRRRRKRTRRRRGR